MAKMRDWAIRSVHEAQMHEKTCFITLTYDDEHLPEDRSISVRAWQLFAKRLRRRLGAFRYLACGEYGDETLRPHYHAILFGQDFTEDRMVLSQSETHTLWTSEILSTVWGQGYCPIGPLTFDSAAYCARYALKKVGGKKKEDGHYERVHEDTGEVIEVLPEFATMSRRPGLGTSWFLKYRDDVYPDDFVVIGGKKFRPPKFYDKQLEKADPDLLQSLKDRRRFVAEQGEENTFERMLVRDTVLRAKIRQKEGKL